MEIRSTADFINVSVALNQLRASQAPRFLFDVVGNTLLEPTVKGSISTLRSYWRVPPSSTSVFQSLIISLSDISQACRSRMQSDIETIASSRPDNPSRRNDTTIFLPIFFNRDYFSLKLDKTLGSVCRPSPYFCIRAYFLYGLVWRPVSTASLSFVRIYLCRMLAT